MIDKPLLFEMKLLEWLKGFEPDEEQYFEQDIYTHCFNFNFYDDGDPCDNVYPPEILKYPYEFTFFDTGAIGIHKPKPVIALIFTFYLPVEIEAELHKL